MDLKQLEYFVCVSEYGGFTRAAIELGITQPALSKQIRQLEVELRQTLFHRNGRGIALTQAGKTLFEHAKGILEQTERARQDLRELHGSPMGKVILGITPSAGKILAPNLVTEFQKRFPRASLDILEGTSSHIHDWLLVGRADIGVLYDPPDAPALNITAALHEEVCLICPADQPVPGGKTSLRYADLAHFPLILPSLPHTMRASGSRCPPGQGPAQRRPERGRRQLHPGTRAPGPWLHRTTRAPGSGKRLHRPTQGVCIFRGRRLPVPW